VRTDALHLLRVEPAPDGLLPGHSRQPGAIACSSAARIAARATTIWRPARASARLNGTAAGCGRWINADNADQRLPVGFRSMRS
jgi:hypothetical protein